MMIIGGNVSGGVHGKWPGLGETHRFEGRDLAVTTDFREVFSEVVTSHMGVSRDGLSRIFPRYTAASKPGVIRA
jgi:uncharacterized protein (DUF1501 family)